MSCNDAACQTCLPSPEADYGAKLKNLMDHAAEVMEGFEDEIMLLILEQLQICSRAVTGVCVQRFLNMYQQMLSQHLCSATSHADPSQRPGHWQSECSSRFPGSALSASHQNFRLDDNDDGPGPPGTTTTGCLRWPVPTVKPQVLNGSARQRQSKKESGKDSGGWKRDPNRVQSAQPSPFARSYSEPIKKDKDFFMEKEDSKAPEASAAFADAMSKGNREESEMSYSASSASGIVPNGNASALEVQRASKKLGKVRSKYRSSSPRNIMLRRNTIALFQDGFWATGRRVWTGSADEPASSSNNRDGEEGDKTASPEKKQNMRRHSCPAPKARSSTKARSSKSSPSDSDSSVTPLSRSSQGTSSHGRASSHESGGRKKREHFLHLTELAAELMRLQGGGDDGKEAAMKWRAKMANRLEAGKREDREGVPGAIDGMHSDVDKHSEDWWSESESSQNQ